MNTMSLSLSVAFGATIFWFLYRIFVPKEQTYAAHDFLKVDRYTEEQRAVVRRSNVHQFLYPLYIWLQRRNPFAKQSYQALQEQLEKAGEFSKRPEDIQIAQLFNVLVYPFVFLCLSMLVDGKIRPYLITFGFIAGAYMYNSPVRNLKAKCIKHAENKLQGFTRFVTVYVMQQSGSKTPFDALKESIQRVLGKIPAIDYYLRILDSDLTTKGPERALREFSQRMDEPYVDRFVNNVLLAMEQAGGDQKEINLRLRETLIQIQEQLTDQKIERMQATARVPTYLNVFLIVIYMAFYLATTLLLMF